MHIQLAHVRPHDWQIFLNLRRNACCAQPAAAMRARFRKGDANAFVDRGGRLPGGMAPVSAPGAPAGGAAVSAHLSKTATPDPCPRAAPPPAPASTARSRAAVDRDRAPAARGHVAAPRACVSASRSPHGGVPVAGGTARSHGAGAPVHAGRHRSSERACAPAPNSYGRLVAKVQANYLDQPRHPANQFPPRGRAVQFIRSVTHHADLGCYHSTRSVPPTSTNSPSELGGGGGTPSSFRLSM